MTTTNLDKQLHRLRLWRDMSPTTATKELEWEVVNHLLTDYDSNRAAPAYTPNTSQIERADLLQAVRLQTKGKLTAELLREVLKDLDAAEAALTLKGPP